MTWTTKDAIHYCLSTLKWSTIYPPRTSSITQIPEKTKTVIFRIADSNLEIGIPFERKKVVACYVPNKTSDGRQFPQDDPARFHPSLKIQRRYPSIDGKKIAGRVLDYAPSLHPSKNPFLLHIKDHDGLAALLNWYMHTPTETSEAAMGQPDETAAAASDAGGGSVPLQPPVHQQSSSNLDNEKDLDESEATIEGGGFEPNPVIRKAIERCAVERAKSVYPGFEIVEEGKPYDLLCTKDSEIIHVEVKGTRGDGSKIFLTKNEVEHAGGTGYRTDLVIVHGIRLEQANDSWSATGGELKHHANWAPDKERLTAIAYTYDLKDQVG